MISSALVIFDQRYVFLDSHRFTHSALCHNQKALRSIAALNVAP
jgi:hypothetical protein